MRCRHCGAEFKSSTRLCPVCGQRQPSGWQQGIRCRSCGRYVSAGVRLCPTCSAALSRAENKGGLWLLSALAGLTMLYNVASYDFKGQALAAVGTVRAKVSSSVSGLKERLLPAGEPGDQPPLTPTRSPQP